MPVCAMENKEYDCTGCRYRDRFVDFCGFCTKKILDEMRGKTYGKGSCDHAAEGQYNQKTE